MKDGFVWGAATSAYQIEGAFNEDGKGLSIWDTFCTEKGRILEGQNGEVACDHYHRFREDVALMKQIGLKAYRFSVSWARVLPEGIGRINKAGIQFYVNLVDELLQNGIEPYLTLYHWDLPAALQEKGGFLSEESPEWFAYYTEVIAQALGDKVKHFFTFNEPQCFIGGAFNGTMFAPGIQKSTDELVKMAHHVMLAHGKAVKKLRELVADCKVGYAPTGVFYLPADEKPENIEAAKKANFDVTEENWLEGISWWSDPVILGHYPACPEKLSAILKTIVKPGDLELISQKIDFYGQNIYQGTLVRREGTSYRKSFFPCGHPKTAIGWKVTPEVLYYIPRMLYERYHLPILITENGMSCHDVISLDGRVHDPNRIDYLTRYLREMDRAIQEGVAIEGYFHWSLMDNFEWANGYNERFGFIYVDYTTGKRILKDSAYWYADVINSNGDRIYKK
ncbi:MAG: beta-glucosidase [Lachnospiraceae bacterium]|nr:beta-glucosidase [Lachnospiraceae bacterium]